MIRYTPLGDSAITVALGEGISRSLSADVLRVAEGLRAASLLGVTEIVPAYATVGVFYDPLRVNFDELRDRLRPVVEQSRDAQTTTTSSATRTIRIPSISSTGGAPGNEALNHSTSWPLTTKRRAIS